MNLLMIIEITSEIWYVLTGISCILTLISIYKLIKKTKQCEKMMKIEKKHKLEIRTEMQKIEQRSKQKTIFFLNLVHDIRTSITLLQISLYEYLKSVKNKVTPDLKVLEYNTNKVCRDIVNLLDFERIQKGVLLYNHNTLINISKALDREVRIFKVSANKKNIKLLFTCKRSFYLKINPVAFNRLVSNILDNSVKYTGEDGCIEVDLVSCEQGIALCVKDNGQGISEKDKGHIFLPYYPSVEKQSVTPGLGFGLPIVKHIVDSMNGTMCIESKEGEGTIVKIIFPEFNATDSDLVNSYSDSDLKKIPMAISPAAKPVEAYEKSKQTVFIIEDNIEIITYIYKSMCDCFNIFYAINGIEALDKLKTIPKPDLIISNIKMNKMDGNEFYSNLIKEEKFRNIPVFYLTSQTSKESKINAYKKGIIDYINKPFEMDELVEKIRSFLHNRTAFKEAFIKKMEKKISVLLRKKGDTDFLVFEKKCTLYKISPREKTVLLELLSGFQTKEIASKLFLSNHTVKKHIRSIFSKCKVQNRVELVNCFKE